MGGVGWGGLSTKPFFLEGNALESAGDRYGDSWFTWLSASKLNQHLGVFSRKAIKHSPSLLRGSQNSMPRPGRHALRASCHERSPGISWCVQTTMALRKMTKFCKRFQAVSRALGEKRREVQAVDLGSSSSRFIQLTFPPLGLKKQIRSSPLRATFTTVPPNHQVVWSRECKQPETKSQVSDMEIFHLEKMSKYFQ